MTLTVTYFLSIYSDSDSDAQDDKPARYYKAFLECIGLYKTHSLQVIVLLLLLLMFNDICTSSGHFIVWFVSKEIFFCPYTVRYWLNRIRSNKFPLVCMQTYAFFDFYRLNVRLSNIVVV